MGEKNLSGQNRLAIRCRIALVYPVAVHREMLGNFFEELERQ
jgi:hypothetical protein